MNEGRQGLTEASGRREPNAAIVAACRRDFGALQPGFLGQTVAILNPARPQCVREGTSLADAVAELRRLKVGCVLVVDQAGKLSGIFSERDCILKVLGLGLDLKHERVGDFMTPQPVAQPPDVTIAHALNLMSHGGFRHIPLVDEAQVPVGIISVKDIVDCITREFIRALEG
jgi:CBS domain-containing protein